MNILSAINDENLFRPFFGEDLESWRPWGVALRCLYGLPIKSHKSRELVLQCTGRDASELPPGGFETALFLTGRRSGKSRIAATIAAYESLFSGLEHRLSKGEIGLVPVISPTRFQSGICWKYIRAAFNTPLLAQEVITTQDSSQMLTLKNGIQATVLVGDWRTARGFSVGCGVVDEVCFFGLTEESKVRSDSELIRSLRPSLLTTKGKLIGISSKYAKKGWGYQTWLRQHGSNKGVSPSFVQEWSTLVWTAPSRVMNPTLSQARIDAAMREDPASARSEYFDQWREDISEYVPRSLVEALVVKGRKELLPQTGPRYVAFSDLSGGRHDDAGLAIAHKEGSKTILDFLGLWRAPFNPTEVVRKQSEELKRFGLNRVIGDNYAAAFVADSFTASGIRYLKSPLPKSQLYKELLGPLCSSAVELLDHPVLVDQVSSLERRTRSGGDDVIDHAPGAKDDGANCLAGVVAACGKGVRKIGAMW